jgi:hypothetical protein
VIGDGAEQLQPELEEFDEELQVIHSTGVTAVRHLRPEHAPPTPSRPAAANQTALYAVQLLSYRFGLARVLFSI